MAVHGIKATITGLKGVTTATKNGVAHELKNNAQEICPVLTGRLRDGYQVVEASSVKDPAYLVNEIYYHDFVDQGTERMAPRLIIARAIAMLTSGRKT